MRCKQAVSANARTKIVLQTSSKDAKMMTREFGNSITEHDFINLGAFEAAVKISTPAGVSSPLTVKMARPMKGYGLYEEVRGISRQAYGHPVGEVEKGITQRRTLEAARKTKRPDIGSGPFWGLSGDNVPQTPN